MARSSELSTTSRAQTQSASSASDTSPTKYEASITPSCFLSEALWLWPFTLRRAKHFFLSEIFLHSKGEHQVVST